MDYDVIVIGGGLSGLTAAALLAKRGVKVAVIDKSANPGGSCGSFKRGDTIFDQGAAMLYGFGEKGFNAHRFVFNCLEEPIDVIRHDLLYCVNFDGRRIRFWPDIEKFVQELSQVFPSQKENIRHFYQDMEKLYRHVMVDNPSYTTPDETDPQLGLKGMLKHPVSYIRFLSYLNKSAKSLLEHYFDDPEIFKFFDKLTSTYCYTTVEESPAILAAVMFVDNHVGGSYYPAGSTMYLPGRLEKVIEENGGQMLSKREVIEILFSNGRPCGVRLTDGTRLFAGNLIYSGTVWNLYGKLIDPTLVEEKTRKRYLAQVPTYPSVVLYACIDRSVIPDDTAPVEMLVGNPDTLDESEITAYIFSIDDRTLCKEDEHVVVAIGPTFETWDRDNEADYQAKKEREKARLTNVLEKRFPGFTEAVRYAEIATPCTIERYTNKNGGAVAGPKQMLGQHMFKRMHTKSAWDSLFLCGESTVMGTGTPTVTTSGLSAANAVLKKLHLMPYQYNPKMKNYVTIVDKPFPSEDLNKGFAEPLRIVMRKAARCRYCEHPSCCAGTDIDMPGILRRVTVGNLTGAKKLVQQSNAAAREDLLEEYETRCVKNTAGDTPVEIQTIFNFLLD